MQDTASNMHEQMDTKQNGCKMRKCEQKRSAKLKDEKTGKAGYGLDGAPLPTGRWIQHIEIRTLSEPLEAIEKQFKTICLPHEGFSHRYSGHGS